MRHYIFTITLLLTIGILVHSGSAAITTYTDFAQWQSQVGPFTTIGFTEYPTGTIITDQYAEQGVVFPDGNDFVLNGFPKSFLQDGAGLRDNSTGIVRLTFSEPLTAIAAHHAGLLATFRLFLNGEMVADTGHMSGGGINFFSGIVSAVPFDSVTIVDSGISINLDNIYFGPPIPGPSAFALLAGGFISQRRRRRP